MSSVWRERERTEGLQFSRRLALAGTITAVMTVAASCALTHAGAPVNGQPMIDPEVRAVTQRGTARVLVELRVPETDPARRPGVIGRAQDELLHRLGGTRIRVVRRYATVPLLALEIDAAALARLEAMSDLVTHVRIDATLRPSARRGDEGRPG